MRGYKKDSIHKRDSKTVYSREKSHDEIIKSDVEFKVREWIYFKISPIKHVIRFGKKGKLSSHNVGPYEIFKKVAKLEYE